MRLMQMLNKDELKKEIREKLMIITQEKNRIYYDFFQKGFPEGTYVYVDNQGYHYVVSERGQESIHKITDDVFEITFWVVYPFIVSISFEYAYHVSEQEDDRAVAFTKQLELLDKLGNSFLKRGEIEQYEILKLYPIGK